MCLKAVFKSKVSLHLYVKYKQVFKIIIIIHNFG